MDCWQEEQIQSLLSAKTEVSFFTALSRTASELGFDYCAYGMRIPFPLSKPKFILLNNYPRSWQQRYEQQNYLAIDPTVAHGMRSTMPLVWSDKVFAKCLPFWEDAKAHGLRVGWALPCHDAKGIGGLLTLARSSDNISAEELHDSALKTSWLAHAAHEGLSRLLTARLMPEAQVNLTAREVEVLRWTADGKTSNEVSEIMRISVRAVNFHVNSSRVKLGAANETAAVIKAAMLGLL